MREQPVVVGVDDQPGEVDALVTLLDRLPRLAGAVDHGVIPLLGHLDQVGPHVPSRHPGGREGGGELTLSAC